MGLDRISLDFIYKCAQNAIGGLHNKRMLELGSQEIVGDTLKIHERTGKEYFENRGVLHTSFDLNGMHGSLKVDLSKPIKNEDWLGYFDIVTNSGTSEHIEPYEAQYECFKNIHNCVKTGGIVIHILPDIEDLYNDNYWKGHCNNYYSNEFFEMLTANNNYKLISLIKKTGMIWICIQKQKNISFMDNRKEFLKYITRREGGIIYPDINSRGFCQFTNFIKKLMHVSR